MNKRYTIPDGSIFDDCKVTPLAYQGVLKRLEKFIGAFTKHLRDRTHKQKVFEYVKGLLSNIENKNIESISYLHGYDRQRLQIFIGQLDWDEKIIVDSLAKRTASIIGKPNGILIFDPTSFPKKGTASVGVARQWCGRLGKVENCQVATFMAYATDEEFALIDRRLYLPDTWVENSVRCDHAGIPQEYQIKKTRHQQCLEMLDTHGKILPHRCIAGDDEMGKIPWFRKVLRHRKEPYCLAVPSNTLVKIIPPSPKKNNQKDATDAGEFVSVSALAKSIPKKQFKTIRVRAGHKGWLRVKLFRCQVLAMIEGKIGEEETLIISRWTDDSKTQRTDYYFGWSDTPISLEEHGRIIKQAYRIEECFKRCKSECGLSDYQVRNWRGWHHHVTLSQLALWFLTEELLRQKKRLR